MADPFDFLANGPSLADMVAAQRSGNPAPAPQGNPDGGLFTSALASGTHGAASDVLNFMRTIGTVAGDTTGAENLRQKAVAQQQAATASGRQDLEDNPWSPKGMLYQIVKGVPGMVPAVLGAAGAAAAAPEVGAAGLIGAGAAMFPSMVGGNVEASDAGKQAFTRGQALKALGLGVPEAAVGAILPGKMEDILAHGAEGGLMKRIMTGAATGAVAQGGAGAVTSALTQAMGDPNRSWADYARGIVDGALRGGLQGAAFGGLVHAISAKPVDQIVQDPNALGSVTDFLQLPKPDEQQQLPPPGPVGQLGLPAPDALKMPGPTPDVINAPDQSVSREMRQMPDAQLSGLAQSLQKHGQDPARLADVMSEIAARTGSDQPQKLLEYQPQVASASPIPLPDETDGAHAAADAALADQPKQIEAPLNAGLGAAEPIPMSDRTAPEAPAPMTAEAMNDRIKSVSPGKVVPEFMKGLNEDDAKAVLRDEISQRDQNNTPIGKRLEAIGKELGVLDDKGQVVEEKAPEPAEDPVKAEQELNAPVRDEVPEEHQAKFDRLDDLRQKLLGDNLSHMGDERTDLLSQVDDLQRSLTDPKGRGFSQKIAKATRDIGSRIDAANQESDLAAARGVEPTPSPVTPPPGLVDVSKPSPIAQDVINRATPKANPMDVLKGRFTGAAQALMDLFQKGKMQEGLPQSEQNQTAFQSELNRQSDKLRQVQQMIKANDVKGLSKVDDDFFGKKVAPSGADQGGVANPLTDDHFNSALPATQELINKHADAMDALIQAVKPVAAKGIPAFGKRTGFPGAVAPVEFQQHADLNHIMDQTGSGRAMLDYISKNGTMGWKKNVAQFMLGKGADPSIRFNPDKTLAREANNPLRMAAADYREGAGFSHINIFDRGADTERLALHEMAHANSMRALNAGGPAAEGMKGLYATAKKLAAPGAQDLYGLKNVHEFMAEAHSNEVFRQWLRDQGSAGLSLWDRFKNATFKLLGAEGSMKTMLDRVMEAGNGVMAENEHTPYTPMGVDQQLHAVGDTYDRYRENAGKALQDDVKNGFKDLGAKARGVLLGWRATDAILQDYAKHLPSGLKLLAAKGVERARTQSYSQFAGRAVMAERALPEAERNKLNQVRFASVLGIDPRKTIAEHTWLADNVKDSKEDRAVNASARGQINSYRRTYNSLTPETKAVFEQQRAVNQTQWYQKATHQLFSTLQNELPGSKLNDAFDAYQQQPQLHEDPAGSEKWWKNAMDRTQGFVAAQVRALDTKINDPKTSAEDMKTAQASKESLQSSLKAYDTTVRQAGEAPNFSVQRSGDFYAAAKLATDKDGVVKPGAVTAVQKALDAAGFDNVRMINGSKSASFYARVESAAHAEAMHDVLTKLQGAGHLDAKEAVHSGPGEVASVLTSIAPKHIQRLIAAAKSQMDALDVKPADKDAWEQGFTRQMLDMNPADTMRKFTQSREGTHGADADTAHAFQTRAMAESRGIAQLSMERAISGAQTAMHEEQKAINAKGSNPYPKIAAAQALGEVVQREAQKQWRLPTGGAGFIRSVTHTMEVGASLRYPFTLASQVATLTLPRLGSVHGYVKAADATARSVAEAAKVMQAGWGGNYRSTFGLGYEALKAAGLSDERARFHMEQQNRGSYNTSAMTAAMTGEHADPHTTLGKYVGYANLMGLYSEMFPRVLTATAADKLWKESPSTRPAKTASAGEHAYNMTNSSQLNFDVGNTPRQFTKGGSFGAMSPLMNQFMRFRGNIIDLLYRETHKMMAGDTPLEQKQATKFMVGHLAAITTISGTLGMPMVAGLAGLYDKFANMIDGADNTDIRASYRTWLAGVYGPDIEQVLTRGLPRALGMDFSDLGEDRLLPGTQWLTEKRKFEDSERDWIKSMAGSGVGTVGEMFVGLRDMMQGNYLRGAEKFVPDALRGPMEVARAQLHGGFQDPYGFEKPNVPMNAWNTVQIALGLDPAAEANFDEQNLVGQGQKALEREHSSIIIRNMIQAQNDGNMGDVERYTAEAQRFMAAHPGVQSPLQSMQQTFSERAKANALGLPPGLNPRDVNAAAMTRF